MGDHAEANSAAIESIHEMNVGMGRNWFWIMALPTTKQRRSIRIRNSCPRRISARSRHWIAAV